MIEQHGTDGERAQTIDVSPVGERLRTLDAFRGLAILGVLLYHYGWAWSAPTNLYGYVHRYWSGLGLGRLGVQFFFMVSGFVILMTLERCATLGAFARRRFARLYPAFFVACLGSFALMHAVGPVELHSAPRDLLFGLALVPPTWFEGRFVDPAFWSLTVEAQFYGVVGVAYFASRRRIAAGWSCALLAMLGAWTIWPVARSALSLASHVAFFTAGMAFYRAYQGYVDARWLAAGAALAYAVTCRAFSLPEHALVAAMVSGFLGVDRPAGGRGLLGVLVWLGTISYSLYLIHQNLGLILIRAGTRAGLPDLAAAALATALCLMLATALARGVEMPARRRLLARWRR